MKPVKNKIITSLTCGLFLLTENLSAAQLQNGGSPSVLSNPLFNTLLMIIVVLAVMIVVLSNSLKNVISSDFMREKIRKQLSKEQKTASIMIFFFFTAFTMSAETPTEMKVDAATTIGGLSLSTFNTMVITIAAELLVLGILFYTFRKLLQVGEEKRVKVKPVKAKSSVLIKKLTDTVAIEEEEAIMLDHEYDGIRELDNNLPPWWKYGFYLTILVAVIYMLNYHVLGTGPLQAEEYATSVKEAEAEVAEYMKNSANNVDENTVKLLTEASDLATGKDLYIANCAACHGRAGEGTVGPNLTDDYWLHGGGLKDVFKTIKYGWPDKGMKSWKDDFSPMQIAQITSFLRTFKGTNPTNPKEKQGELYVETEMPADSITLKADSARVLSQILPQ